MKRRLFFAIYPDAATRRELAAAAKPFLTEGKPSPAGNLHLTLAFIGMADQSYQDCLESKAALTPAPRPFTIQIDRAGHFRRARSLWLGPGHAPTELMALYDALTAAIQPCGYALEPRSYTPHITVARKYRGQASCELARPVDFTVDSFCLMESVSTDAGVQYKSLRRFGFSD